MNSSCLTRSLRPVVTADVSDPERLMGPDCSAHICDAGSSIRLEATKTPSNHKDTLGTLADHVVYKERPVNEERLMCAERTLAVSQKMLKDTIIGIAGLTEGDVTVLVASEDRNGIKSTNKRLEAVLQGHVNKMFDQKN